MAGFPTQREIRIRAGLASRAWRRLSGNSRGIIAMLAASFFFVCGDAVMKLASQHMATGQTIMIRGIIATALIWLVAWSSGALRSLPLHLDRLLTLRTGCEVGAALTFQNGLARIPFADASAIVQINPLVSTAAAAVFLKERVGWRRWTATAVGLLGVLLIVRPGTGAFQWASLLLIGAVLFSTGRDLITRRMAPGIHPLAITAVTAPATMLSSLALLPFEVWRTPAFFDVVMLAVPAACMLLGQLLVIVSIRAGEMSTIVPFRYSGIVFALVLSILVWREFPDRLTLTGIAIVVAAGLYTFHREQVRRREAMQKKQGER